MATANSKKVMEASITAQAAGAEMRKLKKEDYDRRNRKSGTDELKERFVIYWHQDDGSITEVGRSDMKSLDKKLEQFGRQYKHGHIRHRYIGASRYSRDSATSGKF